MRASVLLALALAACDEAAPANAPDTPDAPVRLAASATDVRRRPRSPAGLPSGGYLDVEETLPAGEVWRVAPKGALRRLAGEILESPGERPASRGVPGTGREPLAQLADFADVYWSLFVAMYATEEYSRTRLHAVLDAAYQAAARIPGGDEGMLGKLQRMAALIGAPRLEFRSRDEDRDPVGEKKLHYVARLGDRKQAEGPMVDHRAHGYWKHYDWEGEIEAEGVYRRGKKHGEWKEYGLHYDDRRTVKTMPYENGELHGTAVTRLEDGTVLSRGEFRNGELHGRSVRYAPDGRKLSESQWRDGERHGETRIFSNGRLVRIETYDEGKLVSTRSLRERRRGAMAAR